MVVVNEVECTVSDDDCDDNGGCDDPKGEKMCCLN